MASHDKNTDKAQATLDAQVCVFCNGKSAGHVLWKRDGERNPNARTSKAPLHTLTEESLVDEGFTKVGFIHRKARKSPKVGPDGKPMVGEDGKPLLVTLPPEPKADSACCVEQLMVPPEGVTGVFLFTTRRSDVLNELDEAQRKEKAKQQREEIKSVNKAALWGSPALSQKDRGNTVLKDKLVAAGVTGSEVPLSEPKPVKKDWLGRPIAD
ncbi:hypothetical protein HY413_03420 [Candidatus Kaiserbacteria bacterium]|nr:hypothetical protein [Candidatus Kaiserbacteria bacterium]